MQVKNRGVGMNRTVFVLEAIALCVVFRLSVWPSADWYGALIPDCLRFAHTKTCVPSGMRIAFPVCLFIGLVVQGIRWL